MKPFFSDKYSVLEPSSHRGGAADRAFAHKQADSVPPSCSLTGRVAVYDSPAAAPKISDVTASSPAEFIEDLVTLTYDSARSLGGKLPYTVIREIVENLIHADFQEPVISILDSGGTVRFSDQGPGIPDKEKVLMPGFTTASLIMKGVIRGVGSGLPIVQEFLARDGGSLSLEDNLGKGSVITLKATGGSPSPVCSISIREPTEKTEPLLVAIKPSPRLSTRQKKVFSLVVELGEVGPTLVSKELSVGLSTAYRDLAFLEQSGLITSNEDGKRGVTKEGSSYFDDLFS